MEKYKILIADDDDSVRNTVVRYFQLRGYEVIPAINGKEAVEAEEINRPDLVILDVEMPVMNGFEACKIIREKRNGINYIPIIFVSGLITEGIVITGLEIGADEYIRKPYEFVELFTRVKNLLKMKSFIEKVESIENVTFSLVKTVQTRDSYTADHSQHVADIAVGIARKMNVPENKIDVLRKGCLLHDIGKIGVPDQILNKPGKLTTEEFLKIKGHPILGMEICSNLRFAGEITDIIRHHHEKLDGSGYPDGLKGNEIDWLVRIVTVLDIYDALTTSRPYRFAMNDRDAFVILNKEAVEGKLDDSIIACLEKINQNKV